jgi:S-adenosylmethionine hydrolase
MPIITLSSDWGLTDGSAAVMKGRILSAISQATIVDISHEIPPFDQVKAAYILASSWHHFPPGTIHLICFGMPVNDRFQLIALENSGHYFIGFNDGLFALIFDKDPAPVYALEHTQEFNQIMQAMVKATAALVQGKALDEIGQRLSSAEKKNLFKPVSGDHCIRGRVIMIDRYENAITNINREFFNEAVNNGRNFEIILRVNGDHRINRIVSFYHEVSEGEVLARFNSSGFLEIAINRGYASSFFGINEGDGIRIELKN